MNPENYTILGVEETATDDEIKAAYESLKAKYNEEKWQDGEAGNQAARMLGKLDAAYQEIMEERAEQAKSTSGPGAFEEVSNAIKSGDYARAQSILDNFNERSAEWHYLQSVVFYKKNWINESKKQLEIAIQMDGENTKYRDAYEKLKAQSDYKKETGGAPNVHADPASGDAQMGGNWCSSCASMCYTYLCINCLCNLCCSCR